MRTTIESRTNSRGGQEGHMLLVTAIVVLVLATSAVSMVGSVTSSQEETASGRLHLQRLVLAESGLDAAILDLQAGGDGNLGTAGAPLVLGSGAFWTEALDLGDGHWSIRAHGVFNGDEQVLSGSVRRSNPVFHHAVFAGNSSGDPTYTLEFEGSGAQADVVNGNTYSGGNIDVLEDASVSGDVRAGGTITGVPGTGGVTEPIFDFRGVDFSGPDIVDVVAEFALEATPAYDAAGGTADQLPETNPAHILRRNPSNRTDETSGTVKDDYFLEDPHETPRPDMAQDGTDPYVLSIDDGTGMGETRRAYYIDGNLWVHSGATYSFQFETHPGLGVQVTFIVRGNIYFSDNLFLEQQDRDALAFIALKDEDVEDSGNVYFGDPRFGTVREMHGFLYAENDFYDLNLDASGSEEVRVLGSMTAGNQIAIDRTTAGGHTKLTVDWDSRLQTGGVALPLISTDIPQERYLLEAWIEDDR